MPDDEILDQGAIERRIGAVTSVRQVVHAIWALSRAQLPLAEAASAEATEYLAWVDRIVERVAGKARALDASERLWVVFGPERAYAGSLPRRVLGAIPRQGRIGLVGARTRELLTEQEGARLSFALPGAAAHDEAEAVARDLAHAVLTHAQNDHVELLYPRRSGATVVIHHAVLLASAYEPAGTAPDTYSPLGTVLDRAVREVILGRLTVAAAETLHAEVRARIEASDQARAACDQKLTQLRQTWRVARQEQITNELLEVVAGRQATIAAGH